MTNNHDRLFIEHLINIRRAPQKNSVGSRPLSPCGYNTHMDFDRSRGHRLTRPENKGNRLTFVKLFLTKIVLCRPEHSAIKDYFLINEKQ